MPTIALNGDSVGPGAIQASASSTINGTPIALIGDAVSPHPPCPDIAIHCNATTGASSSSTINGKPIVLSGDVATCGHSASASASSAID